MTRNDTFFKVLFAIQLALLPLVIFAYIFLPAWTMGVFIAGIVVAKVWAEIFKDKNKLLHTIILSIGTVLTFATLLILFYVASYIHFAMMLAPIILVLLFAVFRILLFSRSMPEFIDAVDFCFMLFEIIALIAFCFISYFDTMSLIGVIAMIITSAVAVGYRIYFIIRYTDFRFIFRRKRK